MNLLIFLKELIKNNPAKIIFIIVGSISFHFAGTFSDSMDSYRPIYQDTIKLGDVSKYIYISENSGTNTGLSLHVYTSPMESVDGEITDISYNGLNALFWVLFVASIIIVSITSLVDDGYWEFENAINSSYYSKVVCTFSDGVYYYTLNDRLLLKNTSQYDIRYIKNRISDYREGKNALPEWIPLSEKRGRKLEKIGI